MPSRRNGKDGLYAILGATNRIPLIGRIREVYIASAEPMTLHLITVIIFASRTNILSILNRIDSLPRVLTISAGRKNLQRFVNATSVSKPLYPAV